MKLCFFSRSRCVRFFYGSILGYKYLTRILKSTGLRKASTILVGPVAIREREKKKDDSILYSECENT